MATEQRIPCSERLKTPDFGLVRVLTWRKGGFGPSGNRAQVRDAAAAGAERLDHDGVELGARTRAQLLLGLVRCLRGAVGTLGDHRVEGVADGHDPRAQNAAADALVNQALDAAAS